MTYDDLIKAFAARGIKAEYDYDDNSATGEMLVVHDGLHENDCCGMLGITLHNGAAVFEDIGETVHTDCTDPERTVDLWLKVNAQ